MRCAAKWQYLTATITVFMPDISDCSDAELEGHLVHELCHCLVNELREAREDWLDHEERVVTGITNAILWTRNHALQEGHKETEVKDPCPILSPSV